MTEYKIVASDLDGTLLNNQAKVSPENLAAISALLQKGVQFVPSSGRTLAEIPKEILDISDIRYIIHSNGAVVLDRQTGNRITTCISNATVREILKVLSAFDVHITLRHNGLCLADSACQTDEDYIHYNVIEAHRICIRDYGTLVDNIKNYAYNADNLEVCSVFFHSYEEKLACKKILEQNSQLRVVEACEYNLEIVHIDAGKGNALYQLADLLGVDRKATISLGDSDNDSSITQAAGLGLAMSNACDSLKAVADAVICSNEDHVVAYVLANYF